jgi:channel protein (hemolysin III family)
MLATTLARPRLRGVSHQAACYVSVVAGAVLVALAGDRRTMIVTAVYAILLSGMFGVSATLHRRDWRPRSFGWWRRADHAMIFACIAGTYTPYCVLGLDSSTGDRLLLLAWLVAGLGILRAMLWPHAPRVVTAGLFVAAGWVMVAGDLRRSRSAGLRTAHHRRCPVHARRGGLPRPLARSPADGVRLSRGVPPGDHLRVRLPLRVGRDRGARALIADRRAT